MAEHKRRASQRGAARHGAARHGTARSTVQRNALIRVAACAEFERLTYPRDTHVSDEITRSSVRSLDIPGDTNKTRQSRSHFV